MKFGKKQSVLIGLFLLFVALGGLIFARPLTTLIGSPEETELPETNIVDYELTSNQEEELIMRGITILKFYYNLTSDICLEQKYFLEQLMSTYGNQLVLEEILSEEKELPKLTVLSYYGGDTLTDATQDEIMDILCDLMVEPPLECSLREV
jgi:hypothetical protein